MKRRNFVAGAGATAAIALAGCSGILGGGGGSDSPEGVVKEAYDASANQDADAFKSVLHSESPQRPVDEEQFNQDSNEGEVNINVQSTEVINDDPGEQAIRDQMGQNRTEETMSTLVDVANNSDDAALVEAEVEFTFTYQDQEQTETQTNVHLTATEDGSWKLVA